jgi:DNA-binding CsgD family transcriptional regulator
MPLQTSDWRSTRLGRVVSSVPDGWWEEYASMAKREYDPGIMMARSSLMACTWTETIWRARSADVLGRPPLAVGLWVRTNPRQDPHATFSDHSVCGRQLCCPAARAINRSRSALHGKRARITPRELAVLRLVSMGRQTAEIAKALELGEETVRSHLKKAQSSGRATAPTVAEAIRRQLIP